MEGDPNNVGGAIGQIRAYFETASWITCMYVVGGVSVLECYVVCFKTQETEVVASKNLGQHVNDVFAGGTRLEEAQLF